MVLKLPLLVKLGVSTIPLRAHLISQLYGVFSYCNGLRELFEGMLACEGKLTDLGMDKAPARSTLSDANSRRSYLVFEAIYFELVKKYHGFISDSRLKGVSIRNLRIIDCTTIRLFSNGLVEEQYITMGFKDSEGNVQCLKLRRIIFKTQEGKQYVRKTAKTKKSFSNMITVIRLHLTSYASLMEFIKDTYEVWRRVFGTGGGALGFSP